MYFVLLMIVAITRIAIVITPFFVPLGNGLCLAEDVPHL
jgi:hypothetical protein